VCVRWRGDYGDQKQLWFPSNFVEEIDLTDESTSSNRLGKIEKGSVELAGATVGKCLTDPCDTVPHAHHAVHRCQLSV